MKPICSLILALALFADVAVSAAEPDGAAFFESRIRPVLVLLVAAGISALTGDATGALIIGLIVLMSVTLDFVQAHRAGRAAQPRDADPVCEQVQPGIAGAEIVQHDACAGSAERRECAECAFEVAQRCLLSHGDAWCLGDVDYQRFRAYARDPGNQARFLAQPIGGVQ